MGDEHMVGLFEMKKVIVCENNAVFVQTFSIPLVLVLWLHYEWLFPTRPRERVVFCSICVVLQYSNRQPSTISIQSTLSIWFRFRFRYGREHDLFFVQVLDRVIELW